MHHRAERVYAIADLHLPGITGKAMDVFGPHWHDHARRIAEDWDARVQAEDVVLVPGDISWAMTLEEAVPDLAWLGARPGVKVLIRGNHDYWWKGIGKIRRALPPGCLAVHNDAWVDPTGRLAVAGTRLWDVPCLAHGDIFTDAPQLETCASAGASPTSDTPAAAGSRQQTERLFAREVARLEMSLNCLPAGAAHKVVMTHFPPTNIGLDATAATDLLARHGVEVCVFGHLHGVRTSVRFEGSRQAVTYRLVSADYARFQLVQILEI